MRAETAHRITSLIPKVVEIGPIGACAAIGRFTF